MKEYVGIYIYIYQNRKKQSQIIGSHVQRYIYIYIIEISGYLKCLSKY